MSFNPPNEPFDLKFQKAVAEELRWNHDKYVRLYKRIDGSELTAARFRLAMDLPHQSGRKLLVEKFARMEFLYGISFNEFKGGKMTERKQNEVIYDVRWTDNRQPPKSRIQKYGKSTLGQAQEMAIEMSEKFGYCEIGEIKITFVGEVEQEEILRRWAYLGGQEVELTEADLAARKEVAVKKATKELQPLETVTKETKMTTSANASAASAGKPVTKVPAAVAANAKSTGKAAKPVKAAKAQPKAKKAAAAPKKPTPKAEKVPFGAPGSVLAQFGAREGSFRALCLQELCDNKGKMLPVKQVLKATYGSASEENIGKLNMVLKGVVDMAKANDIAWHLERGKDDKDSLTLGLKAGKA